MNIQQHVGESKYHEIEERMRIVALALERKYDHRQVSAQDLEQVMWIGILEHKDPISLLAKEVKQIVNLAAWRAKDWARGEFAYHNRNLTGKAGEYSLGNEGDWQFFGVGHVNPYDELDDQIDLEKMIEETVLALGGLTESIAIRLMAGLGKRETATDLEVNPGTVTKHLAKMRDVLSQEHIV